MNLFGLLLLLTMSSFARFHRNPDELAIVIAFDPGGTTGFAVLGVLPERLITGTALHTHLAHVEYGQIDCGTRHGQTGVGMARGHDGMNMPGEYDGIVRMLNVWDEFDSPAVVIEDFVLDVHKANRGRDLLTPVRIISGFTTLMQYSFGPEALEGIFIQNRSLAKTTCTDDRLKHWSIYDSNSGPHARDAVRHAFYFLRDCCGRGLDARRKRHLSWPHLFDDPEVYEPSKVTKTQVGERITGLG